MSIAAQHRRSRVIRGALPWTLLILSGLAGFASEVAAQPASSTVDSMLTSVGDQPLWDSPTAGKPLDLRYLPHGFEALIAVRPARLLKHPEAAKLFDPQGRVLGPTGELLTRDLPAWIGVNPESIDQLLVAVVEGLGRPVDLGLVVRFVAAQSEQELVMAWGNPRSTEFTDSKGTVHRIYKGARHGFYFPPAEQGKVLVVIPPLSPADLAAHLGMLFSGALPAVPVELQNLARASDADRHLTIVGRPAFLLKEENNLFSGAAARVRQPLAEFLSFGKKAGSLEMPGAVLLSFHLADSFFAELRLLNPLATQAAPKNAGDPSARSASSNREVAQQLQARIDALPRRIKHYLFSIFLSPYAKNVLIDFDSMLQQFAAFTRVAADDGQVVSRTHLPAGAAHHLALCTYLSLQENYVKEAPLVIVQSRTAQKLQKKTSLIIERDTLDRVLEKLGEKVGVTFEVLKNDLQLDGITKGQSIGVHEINKTGKEILETILKKAHPNLVFFIRTQAEVGRDVVYISTRDGVIRRKMSPPAINEVDATPLEPDEVPSLDNKLAKKISMEFPRNPLEQTMRLLSEALDIEIEILGGDLQLDGITKNQSSGMNERDKPGREILLGFLNRAHPKLVYFSKPKAGSPGVEVLYISSQSGVQRRLEQHEVLNLPPEFRSLIPVNKR